MESATKKQSKLGFLGKISILIGVSNIFLLGFGCADVAYNTGFSRTIFFVLGISLLIGIGAGFAAFISNQAWVGLTINVLMTVLIIIVIGLGMISLIFYATYKVSKSLGLAP